ncbi:MAG TPA: hypothetical protein VFW78_01400 [Bacteroidia bacterium]|nr:hypothetical protein [Bacteroidia bacterium]
MMNKRIQILALLIGLLTMGCQSQRNHPDVSKVEVNIHLERFEQDLFSNKDSLQTSDIAVLKQKYGHFFYLFCNNVIRIGSGTDTELTAGLNAFIHDPEVKSVQEKINKEYPQTAELEKELSGFLKHLKYYFPEKPLPEIVTYNSAFNYAVVTADSVLGIGLDMFLGANEESYIRLGIPKYMFDKFSREYILPSCVKGWFQSDFDGSDVKGDLISQMIYQGKLLYYMDLMVPDLADTLKTGYTATQLEWCRNNEEGIWAFFIDKKLLFNNDPSEYVKYINDGPTTSGFPPDSPGKIGAWIGWQIVQKYMNENPSVTIEQLLKEQDAQKILEKSHYKPQRKA